LSWSRDSALGSLARLGEESEKAILRRLDQYPELLAQAAEKSEPHVLANYLRELAGDFHSWYNAHKMLVDDQTLRDARLALSEAVRQVIANGLGILGLSAPESM
jgi:arginyl-tRNA synthetase